uniref:Telomere repeat binding bouquet formation protein 2 n=1 Tax=Amphiprion percula TaxID=161767 RepID=A0A3P8TEJ2_AMPPE
MFRGKTAWFSSSVPQTCHNFWILEGGTIASWKAADYLFSEDATCPDTLRIFESKDYLWNKVTVFHSFFLSVCERWQSVKSVCIGHYVLPPATHYDFFSVYLTGHISMDNLQKYQGELCDFQPECVQCCKCKANIYKNKAC